MPDLGDSSYKTLIIINNIFSFLQEGNWIGIEKSYVFLTCLSKICLLPYQKKHIFCNEGQEDKMYVEFMHNNCSIQILFLCSLLIFY